MGRVLRRVAIAAAICASLGTVTAAEEKASPPPAGGPDLSSLAPVDAAAARAIFERFKRMAGDWKGHSTQGWRNRVHQQVIARGSTVMSTSQFEGDAENAEAMATMIHMDGDRLLLTHYCEAENQPRLVASGVGEQGAVVEFTFLDGTNLPSRDRGHMDRVVFRFVDDDHYTSRWTWYRNGQERWLEDITYARAR